MPLDPGTRLGPCEILGLLGAGGMGEVYRARDTRLGRLVAVKVISSTVLDDADGHRRLLQEARAASALNHPNIVAIHDVGIEEGTEFVAMELVDGQPLSDKLTRGALPLPEALKYAIQIADVCGFKSRCHDARGREMSPGRFLPLFQRRRSSSNALSNAVCVRTRPSDSNR